jgi:hypothetical protein
VFTALPKGTAKRPAVAAVLDALLSASTSAIES